MKQAPKHPVRLERQGRIALIVIENPPVNALGAAVRKGIGAALGAALANDRVDAIVLAANGRTFPVGADIREFDMAPQEPSLRALCDMVEASSKPVIAALQGTALGGGLELAMAAHYRIAATQARVGLPEINLGLLPGAGGTQRLPRLVGAELAMDLILAGSPISAGLAAEMGLLTQVTGGDLRAAAVEFAKTAPPVRRTGALRDHLADGAGFMAATKARRAQIHAQLGKDAFAPLKVVDCVEAALLLPLDGGIQMEQAAFEDCLKSRASLGLRHAFFAERRMSKFAEGGAAKPAPVSHVAVVGGGALGSELAIAGLQAGFKVTLVEAGEAGVNAALERIGAHYEQAIAKGRMSQSQGAAVLTHLNLTTQLSSIGEADLILDAEDEGLPVALSHIKKISDAAGPSCVIVRAAPVLDLAQLAQASGRPQDVVGLHFFGPAHTSKLAELAVHGACGAGAVMTAHGALRAMGKLPVRVGGAGASIGGAMQEGLLLAADVLLEEGAGPAQIDEAMRAFGFALGPYEMADAAGLDAASARRAAMGAPRDAGITGQLASRGWLGRKTARGYYMYDGVGAGAGPCDEALELLAAHRRAKGLKARAVSSADIQDRLFLAMVNTGARLIGEGVAARPSDIDAVMVHALGYPRARGGPMLDADLAIPSTILNRIAHLAKTDPSMWPTAPVLDMLARERRKFAELNRL